MDQAETKDAGSLTLLALAVVAVGLGCGARYETSVLIHMMDAQETFFRTEVVPSFTRGSRTRVNVVHMNTVDSIAADVARLGPGAGLIKIPFYQGWGLVERGVIAPLESLVTAAEMEEIEATYLLTSLGRKEGKTWFIPRKFETRLMVYSRKRVAEVVARRHEMRSAVDSALQRLNGRGLPAAYVFKEDPGQWDFFDLFFAGYVWSRTTYHGREHGRVAHQGRRYGGTSQRIVDRVFQCGGSAQDVLLMSGDAVVDAFEWEAAYALSGVYNPRMWEKGWGSLEIWEGFGNEGVFLSFLTQSDCFFLHGTGNDGLQGYLDDPADMGIAVMPAGGSLQLNELGDPLRSGSRAITTGGWWWGVAASSSDTRAAYRLARHITSVNNQIQGCTRFGMIPVRKDILSDITMMFGGGWVTRIYEASFHQLMHNASTAIPDHPAFGQIADLYLDAWFDLAVQRGVDRYGSLEQGYIARRLAEVYAPRVQGIIAESR